MEPLHDREVSSPSHAQANHDHLIASIWGPKAAHTRATESGATHPVEPVQTHPVEPPKPTTPTHPVEPPTHPVEPPKPPNHPVEPPTHPVEPHQPVRNVSPPAEPFRPRIPEKEESKNSPISKDTPSSGDSPAPAKPVVVKTPPEHTKDVPPPVKSHTEPAPEVPTPSAPKVHGRGGEFSVTIDHTYKSDEVHQTIRHTVIHAEQQSSAHAQAKQASHEMHAQHGAKSSHAVDTSHHTTHHSDSSHRAHHADSSHHSSSSHHSHHSDSARHASSHHSRHSDAVHHSTHHSSGGHHALSHRSHNTEQHSQVHHNKDLHQVIEKAHQKDQAHTVDAAAHQQKRKDIETTTIHTDTKHLEEHTSIHINGRLPEAAPAEGAPRPIEPTVPQQQSPKNSDASNANTEPEIAVVKAPPTVQSPPAEPIHVVKTEEHRALKPADTNELSTAVSQGQVAVTLTHEHHLDPKTYVRGSVMAGVAGDHVGLGNTELTLGRHLFTLYDSKGNPARGNLNLEAGGIFKTGHTYDYGKLPRFGDTGAHIGLNGYYQPKNNLTLYGSADFATNPKQHDYQVGAIFDTKKTSLQLGFEQSKVEGYGASNYFTPGLSFKTGKNSSVYVSGALDLDGHKERNGLWTGFRLGF